MARVFLSHTSKDKPKVRQVANHFRNAGVQYWLDEAEIKPGESLITKIGQALKASQYVAAFLSVESIRSSWVETELNIAMTQEIAGRRVRVIPIRLDDCELPPFLVDKYYVDLRSEETWNKEIAKLLRALRARFWKLTDKMTYYDAMDVAEKGLFWRLPTIEEAEEVGRKMRRVGVEATALWTSTWKDQETSYVLGYEEGDRVECSAAEHFASLDCVLVRR
jgi:hypothetical protein